MTTAEGYGVLLSPRQAGELLGCSDDTVRRMVRQGELKAERHGRNMKIARAHVEKLRGSPLGPTPDELERRELVRKARRLMAELGTVLAELEA